jgi:hypothetical protein
MPVTSIFWPGTGACDLHLIPGVVGPRLDHLLWFEHTTGNKRADTVLAGVAVAFAANFPAGPAAGGIVVSASGEVTVNALPAPPNPRLLDFLVIVTVTEGANVFTSYKRFIIHQAITGMWLTPSPLTVHKGARNVRFTALAEFDDGTYGDVTMWCPQDPPAAADRTYVHLNGDAQPAIVWSTANAAVVDVHPATGVLNAPVVAGNAAISASRKPLPAPPAASATGIARAADPWTRPTTLTALMGPGFPGLATTKNILILPDGFTAAQRPEFERTAQDLVKALATDNTFTRPYDLLSGSLNYFSAWVASPADGAGVSVLELVRRFNVAGAQADAEEVDTAVAPAATAGAWTVGVPPAPGANNRFLLNERDTAFGTALGGRPRAQRFFEIRDAVFNPSRLAEEDFDDFLKNLTDPAGNPVGARWARGGIDQERIVVLMHTNRRAASNSTRVGGGKYIGMAVSDNDHHRIQNAVAPDRGKNLLQDPVPGRLALVCQLFAAHELAHSFGLEDEYGGGGRLPASKVAGLAPTPNVQPRSTLLTGANLDADKVKWRWPRIRAAGVLTAPPAPLAAGRLRVTLQPGHAANFSVGDVVRLRKRPLLPNASVTDRFLVNVVVNLPADQHVDLEQLFVGPFDSPNWPAGTVLMAPVRGPDPNPAGRVYGPDLELMHTTVRARINASRNPLNAGPAEAANRACVGGQPIPTPATNFTAAAPRPNPPRYSSWLVGLYENGNIYDCDIYRPTGICLMLSLSFGLPGVQRSYQFCPVCRYALVDLIDPSKHGDIDKDYARKYPR